MYVVTAALALALHCTVLAAAVDGSVTSAVQDYYCDYYCCYYCWTAAAVVVGQLLMMLGTAAAIECYHSMTVASN
jgi:hypothetical protein